MEGLTQIMPLNGAMNQDDDHRYVRSSDGQVIERVNLRPNSIDGKRFINEKIKGNTLINIVLPSGNNKCIGWCNDFENSAIIAFIYNSNYLHSILRYFQKTKTIEKVWYGQTNLGFEDANVRAFIADGMLYWVNGDQQPKSFVIDYAVRFTNSLPGDKYDMSFFPFSDVIFPMIKRPPQFAPTCKYTSSYFDNGLVVNYNNLRRKMFQFKYRYVYLDNQQSAWSPISKVPLPSREVTYLGEFNADVCINNTIEISINSGSSYVKKIDVAVRQCYDRSALGDFYLFKTINRYDNELVKISTIDDFDIITTNFLNTTVLENINTTINNRYCDDVPLSGNDTLLLDGKYCAISMPRKNYDLKDVDYDLEIVENEIFETVDIAYLNHEWVGGNHHWYIVDIVYQANSDYYISFVDGGGHTHLFHVNSDALGGDEALAQAFRTLILADHTITDFQDCVVQENGGIWQLILNFGHGKQPFNFEAYYYPSSSIGQNVTKSLKRGQYHPFVIIYNDGFGRYGIAQGDKELFSPTETECPITFSVQAKVIINNKPPDWAVSYRIGYLPNHSYLYFIQLIGVSVWKKTDTVAPAGVVYTQYPSAAIIIKDIPTDCYFIAVNNAIWNMREANPNLAISDYIFMEGDRLRKPCSPDTFEVLREITVNYWDVGDDWDTDDPKGTITGILTKENFQELGKTYTSRLEIYRPNPSIQVSTASYNNVFYETGDEYEIFNHGEPNARHGNTQYGQVVDGATAQTLDVNNNVLTPAELILNFGDVYIRNRAGYLPSIAPPVLDVQYIEDINYTDFFVSSGIDIGRVTAKIESKQKTLNSIVRGEQFLEGTETNWLNVFILGTKSFDASDLYGPITGIEEMGGTLKVIQEHKEGSITIGEVTAKFADVGEFTYIGDAVFGAYRRYPEDRGTTYRRSMAQNNRYLYYFDESTSEFIRSSPNGQAPVSKEYSMQNWFEKKAKQLREYVGDKDVVTSFDNDYEEVLVSFRIGNTIETIVFSEKEGFKGWMEYRTYFNDTDVPELFASFKDTLVSWMNGKLYLHNSGLNNTFYGKLHGCSLKVPVNGNVQYTKRYSSIRLSSDKNLWSIEFTIPDGENYVNQKTILRPAMFREKENALYSDILRNIITRTGVEDLALIYNGTRMVGEFMDVEIKETTNQDVFLGAVQVNYQIAK